MINANCANRETCGQKDCQLIGHELTCGHVAQDDIEKYTHGRGKAQETILPHCNFLGPEGVCQLRYGNPTCFARCNQNSGADCDYLKAYNAKYANVPVQSIGGSIDKEEAAILEADSERHPDASTMEEPEAAAREGNDGSENPMQEDARGAGTAQQDTTAAEPESPAASAAAAHSLAETTDLTFEEVQRRTEAIKTHSRIMADFQAINSLLTEFCELLKTMRDKKLYTSLGCETFDEYVESRCHIKARQAYTYISTYERMGAKRLAEHADIGITKLSLLAQMYPEDAESLMAENDISAMSTKEVERLVAKEAKQGEQLSMLEAEKKDAESSEAFLKKEVDRLTKENEEAKALASDRERLKQELAAAQEQLAGATPSDEALQKERDRARVEAQKEVESRLADQIAKDDAEKRSAVQAAAKEAEASHRKELDKLRAKAAADEAEAEKRARRAAENAFAAEKERAVKEALERGKAQGAEELKQQKEAAEAEAEKLRREMAVATDRETLIYTARFDQINETVASMLRMLDDMKASGETEKAHKLAKASIAAFGKVGEKFEEHEQ